MEGGDRKPEPSEGEPEEDGEGEEEGSSSSSDSEEDESESEEDISPFEKVKRRIQVSCSVCLECAAWNELFVE